MKRRGRPRTKPVLLPLVQEAIRFLGRARDSKMHETRDKARQQLATTLDRMTEEARDQYHAITRT